jgi:hypothetical protein
LNERPKWKVLPRWAGGNFGLILILIALSAAIPRFRLGASQFVEYDGYWHIFIAQQDNWGRFWHDVYVNAHPPLYFLLLKAVLLLGHSFLIYRAISIATGIASVVLVGLIARRVTESQPRALQTALTYGLAMPGIIISCEVRSYMLSEFFVLLSFWWLLRTTGGADASGESKTRTGFALGAILACLSHYYAFFYAGAAMLLLAARFIVRAVRGERTSLVAETATSLPILVTIATLYSVHAGRLAEVQGHLLPFYYTPHGPENVAAFLTRNWKNLLDWFSPVAIPVPAALALLAAGVIGGVVSVRAALRAGRFPWTFPITAVMLAAIALAGVAGKYPFGGDLRQQFLLFPFFILCGAVFVERIAAALAMRVPAPARHALNAVAAAAIVLVSVIAFRQYPKVSDGILADRMALFHQLEPKPAAVYLDQFNLITFFIYYDQWKWTSVNLRPPIPDVDVYRLTRGDEQMYVFRDTGQWNIEPQDPAVYARLAQSLRAERIPGLSVFSVRQSPPAAPFSDLRALQRDVATQAASAGVCIAKLKLNPVGWYGTFRESGCPPPEVPPQQFSGTFDDRSADIHYAGSWSHLAFPAAAGGSLSFSNLTASTAKVTFDGTQITWVYSKAFNRGIAEVRIDGLPQGELDQYGPKIKWQSKAVYGNLAPGRHTFELTVTGRKRPAATDRYVDVDALVAR